MISASSVPGTALPMSPPSSIPFAGRDEVDLGSYDSMRAWQHLQGQLLAWRDTSGMWDPRRHPQGDGPGAGHHRRGGGGAGAAPAAGWPTKGAGMVLAATGGAVAGAGLAAALRAWELRVRTRRARRPGSGSSRSDGSWRGRRRTTPGAPKQGAAGVHGLGGGRGRDRPLAAGGVGASSRRRPPSCVAYMAPLLLASTTSAATAPSSSGGGFGGGGFGGGSVGGGAGGGGGGGW